MTMNHISAVFAQILKYLRWLLDKLECLPLRGGQTPLWPPRLVGSEKANHSIRHCGSPPKASPHYRRLMEHLFTEVHRQSSDGPNPLTSTMPGSETLLA
ncbi:hypothetical protein AVEN_39884-1 [Araneus ventricosus]|uniref:Uncharacterized protein n=1 Tax=Araneus ventricosus TaxID=182803 RepID=A0A4Y2V9I1_ARAVE|nr:hypothetical protein AVEN_39884-1 [Araneus ventricosus]